MQRRMSTHRATGGARDPREKRVRARDCPAELTRSSGQSDA
jgi:hypothetical protein